MCYLRLSKHYFNKTLFPKCLDMRRPRYTSVAPVNAQGEYNIPPEDSENGDDGSAPFWASTTWETYALSGTSALTTA